MAVSVERLIAVQNVVRYDGSNAQDIVAAMDPAAVAALGIEVVAEADGAATFGWDSAGPQSVSVSAGDYVVVDSMGGVAVIPAGRASTAYVKVSDLV